MAKKNHREIEKLESTFAQEMRQELKRVKQLQVLHHLTAQLCAALSCCEEQE